VVVLLLVAGGMQAARAFLDINFRKMALPLVRSLDLLDQGRLLPEYVPHRIQPPLLTHEAVVNLGTEEYLNWNLTDLRRERDDPTALAALLITYHTGGPGLVPHYPEECLAASGMVRKGREVVEIEILGPGGVEQTIPVKILTFELPRRGGLGTVGGSSEGRRLVVAYFFLVNGRYATTRTEVRRAVSNLWDRYAYYSKIEISFSDDSRRRLADQEQAVAATKRLLGKLMPILWEDHYQDWEAIKSGTPPVISD
jgi:hypothetical protein